MGEKEATRVYKRRADEARYNHPEGTYLRAVQLKQDETKAKNVEELERIEELLCTSILDLEDFNFILRHRYHSKVHMGLIAYKKRTAIINLSRIKLKNLIDSGGFPEAFHEYGIIVGYLLRSKYISSWERHFLEHNNWESAEGRLITKKRIIGKYI